MQQSRSTCLHWHGEVFFFFYMSSTRLDVLVAGNLYGLVMRDAAEHTIFCQFNCKLACHAAVVYIWQLQHVQYVQWDIACVFCAIIRSHPGQHLLQTLDVY